MTAGPFDQPYRLKNCFNSPFEDALAWIWDRLRPTLGWHQPLYTHSFGNYVSVQQRWPVGYLAISNIEFMNDRETIEEVTNVRVIDFVYTGPIPEETAR